MSSPVSDFEQSISDTRPTKTRYAVLAFSVTMAMILYLDRMAISVAVPRIAEDLDLHVSQVGDSVAAFFWCYALLQVPAGWLGDRWGGRRALTLYVVAWSLAIGGMGLVGGLVSLMAMRACLGVSQAGAFATTASFLRRWMPPGRRGMANSAVSLGGRAGNVIAPALTSLLMTAVAWWGWQSDNWRPVFIAYALVGFCWAAWFWRWFRDEPRDHASCNAAEQTLIADGQHDSAAELPAGSLPLKALLTSSGLQMLALANFCVNVGWIFVGTWLPTYLIRAHEKSEIEAGMIASLAAGAGMAGCLCGGLATDFLTHRVGLRWGRRLPGMFSYGGAAVAYAACWNLEDINAIVFTLVIASFLGDFALGALWATYQDIGGPYAGTALGWANMCGNIGAACAISWIGRLVERNLWSDTFALSTVAYLIGALAWLAVDPHKRLRVSAT